MSARSVSYKIMGDIAVLSPSGRLQGIASGPLKIKVADLLEQGTKKFVISFADTISIDRPYAQALNSIHKEVKRYDGKLILSDANSDVVIWLDKYADKIPMLKTREMAIEKLGRKNGESIKGNIAVVGTTDISKELFKGISTYKGLVFHYFDNPRKSIDEIIALKPLGVILNLEIGTILVEPLRRIRFQKELKDVPIILFGPGSMRKAATALIKEGASDYIEVKFESAEVLAYLKKLDFRNVLAKRLDMLLEGEYKSAGV